MDKVLDTLKLVDLVKLQFLKLSDCKVHICLLSKSFLVININNAATIVNLVSHISVYDCISMIVLNLSNCWECNDVKKIQLGVSS